MSLRSPASALPTKPRIAVLAGDGIGPEVTDAALVVLTRALALSGLAAELREGLLGGAAIEVTGVPLPPETVELCRASDAVLCGAVGGPRWDGLPDERNPGPGGLLRLRRELGLYANLRPVQGLGGAAIDLLLVRECTGGTYYAPKGRDGDRAFDTTEYTAAEVERVVERACRLARARRGRVVSVDKANVMQTGRLWREVAQAVFDRHDDLETSHFYVDNCAAQLVLAPGAFDVVVTENLFGDILSDQAAAIAGSLGLAPSATLGDAGAGLFEPVHGSAPDLAGRGIANPTAALLSAALLCRHALGLECAASAIEGATRAVLARGVRTPDVAGDGPAVGTAAFAQAVAAELQHHHEEET